MTTTTQTQQPKKRHPDRAPEVVVKHVTRTAGILTRQLEIDGDGYHTEWHPNQVVFEKYSGNTYVVHCAAGRAVGCDCADHKYRPQRICKHMAAATLLAAK